MYLQSGTHVRSRVSRVVHSLGKQNVAQSGQAERRAAWVSSSAASGLDCRARS